VDLGAGHATAFGGGFMSSSFAQGRRAAAGAIYGAEDLLW
jgi:hypothetical protein